MRTRSIRSRSVRASSCRRSRGCRPTRGEDLRDLRAREDEMLDSYGWVDRNAGIVRIPIDEAMRLTLRTRAADAATGRNHERARRHERARPRAPVSVADASSVVPCSSAFFACLCGRSWRRADDRRARAPATTRAGHAGVGDAGAAARDRLRSEPRSSRCRSTRRSVTSRDARCGLASTSDRSPVVLAFVYYDCPMLCTQVLNALDQRARTSVARRRARTSRS